MEQACKNCRYYEERPQARTLKYNGICRRYPPVSEPRQGPEDMVGIWPRVNVGDWCGEFVAGKDDN